MTRSLHSGFTLLEVLAALLILSTAVFALLHQQTQSLHNTTLMTEAGQATAAAETALDEFLARPEFDPGFGGVLEGNTTVELDGFESFEIHRIIGERDPLFEQPTIYANPDEEPYYLPPEDEAVDEEETIFDPGLFVSIRIEVWRAQGERRLLASVETWLPKPMTEEEMAQRKEELGVSAESSGGASGSGARSSGDSTGGASGGGRSSGGGNRGTVNGGSPAGGGDTP